MIKKKKKKSKKSSEVKKKKKNVFGENQDILEGSCLGTKTQPSLPGKTVFGFITVPGPIAPFIISN